MSREIPNAPHASFIRKSLAAVSRKGHVANPVPIHASGQPSTRNPALQSRHIFNLSLKPFSPARLVSKAHAGAEKHIDPDGSTSLDEGDSMYNEQDSLETDNYNSATYLPSTSRRAPPPPGLPRPAATKYPIIVEVKSKVLLYPRQSPPKHWAPAGSACGVVCIQPEYTGAPMRFRPRPGSVPPSYWHPAPVGANPLPIVGPVYDYSPVRIRRSESDSSGLDQDETYETISPSSSASGNDNDAMEKTDGGKPKNPIHAQLEHMLEMADRDASLPGVFDSVWATCPTPPPSPNLIDFRSEPLKRKTSHPFLNYLLRDCGFDLASLCNLEARFPVPRPEREDVSGVVEECASEVASHGTGNTTDDDLQTLVAEDDFEEGAADLNREMGPTLDDIDDSTFSMETMRTVLEEILQTLDAETMEGHETESGTFAEGERSPLAEALQGLHAETTAILVERAIELAASISRSNGWAAPIFDGPLRRVRSLPECWRMSAFTVFANSHPPSPTPAHPKQKLKGKMYNASPMITAVESLAAPPQSGHAYLRANMQMKSKVKTRPATAVADTEEVHVESPILPSGVPLQRTMTGGTLKKASLLGRFRNGGDEDSKKKWYSMFLKLSKQPAQGLRLLVKGRELSWKDFLKIMADLGFTVTEPDGNSVKFVPPFEKAPTVTLHRPHDRVCRVKHLKKIRKVLMDSYGWVPEEIVAVLE